MNLVQSLSQPEIVVLKLNNLIPQYQEAHDIQNKRYGKIYYHQCQLSPGITSPIFIQDTCMLTCCKRNRYELRL